MGINILSFCYLIGSVTFIVGLKMLSHPNKARKGNLVAASGMFLSILGTLLFFRNNGQSLHHFTLIFLGLGIGSIIGIIAARKVKMTAMPEMVSLFNGMGGLCAALISIVEFERILNYHLVYSKFELFNTSSERLHLLIILAGMVIGSVSFAGSMVAFGKLNGKIGDWSFKGLHLTNLLMLFLILTGVGIFLLNKTNNPTALFIEILGLALTYGILFVMPIGGADMPVVISLLNSFTGVAAACGGFLYHNPVMLTGGILVGSAGTILTILMCRAMNRSLKNVIIGSFGGASTGVNSERKSGSYTEISLNDAAVVLAYAKKVIIVPGYGLAVAQAQHACHDLEKILGERGVEVQYAIHPVAGRMPGHMNVLLAEANVAYEKLLELDVANSEFSTTDAVLVLGANDVVNPAALEDQTSPIFGMPILEVERARMVIVNKRSMKHGYAGIENPLFFRPKTSMLFGDSKQVLQQLIAEIKQL